MKAGRRYEARPTRGLAAELGDEGRTGFAGNVEALRVELRLDAGVRMRRLLLGMNQETLANALGLTFQQVQKYEGGANRVSASRLSAMAEILGVPISYFFGDLQQEDADLSPEDKQWREQLQRPETIEFIRLYYAISDQKVRHQFLEMAKTVAATFEAKTG